jgi:hypothetical protein
VLLLLSLASPAPANGRSVSGDPVLKASSRARGTTPTHGQVAPDYAVVFPQDAVQTIEITMAAEQWMAIRADMQKLYGADFGTQAGGGGAFPARDPEYVPVTVKFRGQEWKSVGFRLKGNSSLWSGWRQGNHKLPFRLHFDRYAKQDPAIKNQRFHGFKELSMSPGYADNSLIREKIAADLFRMGGIPAARTAFYRVYIDFGEGPKYDGVYTMVEVIDDTMVKDQFGADSANIYKPTSNFQSFAEAQFEKKNHEKAADYADVRTAVLALNSELRMTDPVTWRANLEATFNVDHFIKWLAINNVIVNWDSYGRMAHNYYLYNHPTKKLTWIPWDHNMALNGEPGVASVQNGGQPPTTPRGPQGLSLTMDEVTADWPLIRYIIDDPVYLSRYKAHLKAFADSVFTESAMNALFDRYHALIAPYVVGADGEQPNYSWVTSAAFADALPALKRHVQSRRAVLKQYVH